jgi:hypothetical protein
MRAMLVTMILVSLAGTAASAVKLPAHVRLMRGDSIDLIGINARCEPVTPGAPLGGYESWPPTTLGDSPRSSASSPASSSDSPIALRTLGKNRVRVVGVDRGAVNCFGVQVPGWLGSDHHVVVSVFEWPAPIEAACDRGDAGECLTLAYYYLYGWEAGTSLHPRVVLKASPKRALQLLRRVCDAGGVRGCFGVAALQLSGWGPGIYDPESGAAIYQKLCDQGERRACHLLGDLYAPFYTWRAHARIAPDAARAFQLIERACNGGYPMSCNDLGVMYVRGLGVAKDEAKATALYQQACAVHNEFACQNLKDGTDRPGGVNRAWL